MLTILSCSSPPPPPLPWPGGKRIQGLLYFAPSCAENMTDFYTENNEEPVIHVHVQYENKEIIAIGGKTTALKHVFEKSEKKAGKYWILT
jgi:hypothetical protein